MRFYVCVLLAISLNSIYAQVIPPCENNDYGTELEEKSIATQMRYGDAVDAENSINQAKNTKAVELGCPQVALPYSIPDITEPLLVDIENVWNTQHAPVISGYTISCPRVGRYANNAALGAYYAMQAGYYDDTTKLSQIADMMYDQQYANWNITSPETRNEGVYGFLNVLGTHSCFTGDVVDSSVLKACTTFPAYCVDYTNGQFVGQKFLVGDQDDTNEWFDGGLAYDHGWVGVQMIESAIMQSNPSLKLKYRNSVELAGQFAISEYSVKNHNYTAKLIWLLSELYAWTGKDIYRNELNYKLEKNLIPGILWDDNNDGFVDGTSPSVLFSSLTSVAQTPGRMWDAHNSVAWYHAMNTWAITEAYVAFRDQGDITRANELKPYVVAMLDNLANEILTQGVISQNALGVRDITYALLTGIWKINQYENEAHVNWEQAAWAMWNTGYFDSYNTNSVCVGLYLLIQSQSSYIPLNLRENYVLSTDELLVTKPLINVFPNPVNSLLTIEITNDKVGNYDFVIFDLQNKQVQKGEMKFNRTLMDISSLSKGQYTISVIENGKVIKSLKFLNR